MTHYVLAKDAAEIKTWGKANDIAPRDVFYISGPDVLRGRQIFGHEVVVLPGFYRRRDQHELASSVEACLHRTYGNDFNAVRQLGSELHETR